VTADAYALEVSARRSIALARARALALTPTMPKEAPVTRTWLEACAEQRELILAQYAHQDDVADGLASEPGQPLDTDEDFVAAMEDDYYASLALDPVPIDF